MQRMWFSKKNYLQRYLKTLVWFLRVADEIRLRHPVEDSDLQMTLLVPTRVDLFESPAKENELVVGLTFSNFQCQLVVA